ncbi:PREDICTED: polyadenylate-binding protein-interacting protein 9-like isoform X1 [Lupinus angustifolius]|uniref:polyadenylate-binding protein-interacting protein 9-like isoform X1 n=1 Tax=Lupinus angustifolius TaxID=3871 RepID=UPI00092F57A1|nr:PREDICTED: polyadenylate-binding protein-interacting protein 9-like isoform X1 [Lupinus angustifolius]
MAAVAEIANDAVAPTSTKLEDSTPKPDESEFNVQSLSDMFKKLNPLAKEFIPSSHSQHDHAHQNYNQFIPNNFVAFNMPLVNGHSPNIRRLQGRANFNHGRGGRRMGIRIPKVQRENSVRRTVYVSDIDQHITEERLADLFSTCGHVIDCRICGDPRSVLRFAFVEFTNEHGAWEALSLDGRVLGFSAIRVLPSKTAILPVNPTFLPRSADEREMCTRTVYCTNIDKMISQAEVKQFFESSCGEVTRLRLLGDHQHLSRIAFVEFAVAQSAIIALRCSGMLLGTQQVRVSPSKTPVRPRVGRPTEQN